LQGVSEAIDKQIAGQVIAVTVEPKVDQRATEQAAKKTRETVEKQTTQVKVEPKVDARAAERAGKATGEAVAKGANEAVRKGDIGKTVGDEIKGSVQKSSPGRDVAKILVDGIADGVKGELRGGVLVDNLIDGIADGAKQQIDKGNFGGRVADSISGAIKSGNLTGKLKDAIVPGLREIGNDLQSSAGTWGRGIADSLRSGDIEGATTDIGTAVLNTTDLISNIGETFGLQLDGVRDFGQNTATTLSEVGTDVQGVVGDALELKRTFTDTGELLGTVLPGKAGKAATEISDSLSKVVVPVWLTALLGNELANKADDLLAKLGIGQDHPDRSPGWAIDQGLTAPKRIWEMLTGQRDPNTGELTSPPIPEGGPFGTGNGPHGRPPAIDPTGGLLTPPGVVVLGPDGKPIIVPGRAGGGYTGNFPIDKIAGVVHGGEWVLQAPATSRIESDHPGLLDYMNKTGKLPGYEGGGLVLGDQQLSSIIKQRFGINDIGGWRPQDKYGEHSTGRALDVMVGNDRAKGDAVRDFVLANADAVDLKWVIWRQHLTYPGGGGYDMEDRGSPTANHMDHVHIFSGTGIANGLRGALKGNLGATVGASLASTRGAIDPASSDQTASAAAVPSSAAGSSSSGGLGTVPSSLSGLSSWGLDSLGAGVGKTSSGKDLSVFGQAAGDAVSGQLSSALGVLGVGDSPGWLKGISTFIGGLSVSDSSGKKIFDGSNIGASFGRGDSYGGAAPVASSGAAASLPADGSVHGAYAGRGPGPVFNTSITAGDTEQAFDLWNRQMNEQAAARLNRW
jgi:hypothetical protein